jgi:hypothetical protein
MRIVRSLFLASRLTAGVILAESAVAPDFVRIAPRAGRWQDIPGGHGARIATLAGDPDKPGFYVVEKGEISRACH